VDIAGLVKGAHKGEGLGNQFLHAIRESHALCHVVRVFEEENVTHVDGGIDPKRDRETIDTELALADLQTLSNHIDKISGAARTGDKEKKRELGLAEKIKAVLEEGKLAQTVDLSEEEEAIVHEFHLLTRKPIVYAANVAEEQLHTLKLTDVKEQLGLPEDAEVIRISAKVEEDLMELSEEEAKEFLLELGITSSGLDRLIHSAYAALGYITYFTAGPKEVRAWTVPQGATAPEAAGVIHTDFKKGFICAETIAYDDYISYGSELKAKEAGKMRQEGKEYVVKDGDVIYFKFNV
jgi:GTP-binding protein YchF